MEEEDVFEDAKEELVDEQVDTSLHEAVFRNDLPQISALLRSAKERGQVNHNIKHVPYKTLSKTSMIPRSRVWSVPRTTKATQLCTWQSCLAERKLSNCSSIMAPLSS